MTRPEPKQSAALEQLTELARSWAKTPSEAELRRGLNRLLSRVAENSVRPRPGRVWALAAVGLLLVLGVPVALWQTSRPDASELSVRDVEGGRLLEGGYLSEAGDTGVALVLSDDSRFELSPGARGRLRSVDAQGAQFAVERGAASFHITPAKDRRWTVEAGPFLVEVTGTEFTVFWDPMDEELALTLRRGRVLVSGPIVGERLELRPGQRLSVSLPRGETIINEAHSARAATDLATSAAGTATVTAPEAAPGEFATADPAPDPTPDPAPDPTRATPRTRRDWKAAMANGRWDQILSEAEHDGVATTVQVASSDELFALAHAARYRRRPEVARTALLAHRSRFPDAQRSLEALYLLGRVDESRSGGAAQAIEWYDRYLARVPAGTYAAEALGRKMILSQKLHGKATARSVAEEYLRRFPEGSYAGTARVLADPASGGKP